MKQLPSIQFQGAPAWQPARLQRWLHEWTVEQALQGDRPESEPEDRTNEPLNRDPQRVQTPESSRSGGLALAPGQVRLLFPLIIRQKVETRSDIAFHSSRVERALRARSPREAIEKLIYLLVLRAIDNDTFLAVPLAKFSEPAIPGEWLTGRPQPALRVLSLWNAHRVTPSRLSQSWLVDQFSDSVMQQAAVVLRHIEQHSATTHPISDQVGPPLVHPLDPRWEYLATEREMMNGALSDRTDSLQERRGGYAIRDNPEISLAAEAPGHYAARPVRFEVSEVSLFLVATGFDRSGVREFEVQDRDGNRSEALDLAVLRGPDGGETEPIRNAQVEIPHAWLTAELTLITVDGRILPVTRTR